MKVFFQFHRIIVIRPVSLKYSANFSTLLRASLITIKVQIFKIALISDRKLSPGPRRRASLYHLTHFALTLRNAIPPIVSLRSLLMHFSLDFSTSIDITSSCLIRYSSSDFPCTFNH